MGIVLDIDPSDGWMVHFDRAGTVVVVDQHIRKIEADPSAGLIDGMARTMTNADADLRALLSTLDPKPRDDLRRVLIRDQADRDAIASHLMRYRDQNGQDWADIIDFLTMYPDPRRHLARISGGIDAK
jgi:hypothetical protein